MGISNLHDIFMISERLVNLNLSYDSPAWSMWLDITDKKETRLTLKEVNSEQLWSEMFNLSSEIEKEFGDFIEKDINEMISDIKVQIKENSGKWYLAYLESECVGEIGVVPVNINGKTIYRLQDVDIVQSHRGRGLGTDLLNSISNLAIVENIYSLCLRADADDWKKDWYLRYGFQKIGEVGQ